MKNSLSATAQGCCSLVAVDFNAGYFSKSYFLDMAAAVARLREVLYIHILRTII